MALLHELVKEVLGPRQGVEEVLPEDQDPYDEYLTGVLVPQRWKGKTAEEGEDDTELGVGGDTFEDDMPDFDMVSTFSPALDPSSKPQSMGLSFNLLVEDPSIKLCVTWGRYFFFGDQGKGGWKRKSYNIKKEIKLKDMHDNKYDKETVYSGSDGEIYLAIKTNCFEKDASLVVKLVNNLNPEGSYRPDTSYCIFQPSIRINLCDGADLVAKKSKNPISAEDATLQFLYRERPSLARGHMCAAIWRGVDPEDYLEKNHEDLFSTWVDGSFHEECSEFLAPDLRTEFVPQYAIPSPDFNCYLKNHDELPVLSALELSEMWDESDIDRYLSPIHIAYSKWVEDNEKMLKFIPENHLEIAKNIINSQKKASERLLKGINILKKDEDVRLSFCFANRTIWLQNKWKKPEKDFEWRHFQLAFILMNIEPLSDEKSEYRNVVDLLWIPTGGGKTEAYLAIMAFTMALRRRRSLSSSSDLINRTGGGTAVLSRYTLRLLTVQQFRRTVQMITAAEYLRVKTDGYFGWRPKKCDNHDDYIYGSLRFSAGLWVGGGVTPNNLKRKDDGAIEILKGEAKGSGEPAQLTACPACGTWLSIPDGGLPEGEHTLHTVLKINAELEKVDNFFDRININDDKIKIEKIAVTNINHSAGYFTASTKLSADCKILGNNIKDIWKYILEEAEKNNLNIEFASFRESRMGYFPLKEPSQNLNKIGNFEIYCPNPDCHLNNEVNWIEGVPLNIGKEVSEELPDGLYPRITETPFKKGARMPIPAYTVDEQVYGNCPTVIVGTADKIARLAFEPRTASIFGNVDKYNACYGYYRNDLLPPETTAKCRKAEMKVTVKPFSPPDLIVQDELHLINGPLGSMFGLYETSVDSLCFYDGKIPKHIASTATIKHAETQIKSLFAKKLFQFPPHGMNIDDSFYVNYPPLKESWNEEKAGRLYVGICAPGRGSHTPLVRIWSRLLKLVSDNKHKKNIDNFWTLVGYFNAIRELGGALALYRQDILERLRKISEVKDIREIDLANTIELSSRIDSTSLPSILKELENFKSPLESNPDAIFTTSMFGTGIDISHLSLMMINGQPKTTSAYIQATGRVGRDIGALVVSFLKASRPRDMSHYEMFINYHHRIYIDVEPVSVSPFSDGAMRRALGPALVTYLRNMRENHGEWWDNNRGDSILDPDSHLDRNLIARFFEERIVELPDNIKQGKEVEYVRRYIEGEFDKWINLAYSSKSFVFNEYNPYGSPEKDVILGDPAHRHAKKNIVFENAPQSLREVEETTGFEV
ncbi:Superfamily II DNA and RNA helicase [Methanosarcina siciliae C2J]|uniref:Superfamily II DNA and RNA helicase n=1 Tax=Methanosarcina siciliae C2J TaxID=1434118 RepID=A0A0E3PNQ0_9EURY|nr:DISARM system helicase DrmA [Methanosarcina siciliae]AKB37289.1 Superfamily II DNA and RNA helicase [Methanosarcina siciliae C2J]